ncbi:XrtA system polysaccharide deacetylase [Candidatus Nitrospira nitrificans]|uniref:Putative Polysaccharide deacetylase n=1 Tax=Candidatus Nitrospira nitrificans TaxID=1742973 RepID=A0A0S4L4U3_9BACT|nr:XrtA system polysaccharide deacetylase [Candidatus Nitrospira nitrificans]CUS31801.1 putative Polysaccharide deacetylase [Candidatus Nitrospira nitrificans]
MAFNQQSQNASVRHVLSFDVEEHFQVSAFWSDDRRQQWDRLESRVEQNTLRLAELLEHFETKATFFILGWVAERHPGLVKALAKQGHEIASHGYGHELVGSQTENEFRDDVRRSKRILEELTGEVIFGYRAPSFSITDRTPWALPILVEEGYLYDSSIYARFQPSEKVGMQRGVQEIVTAAGPIFEVALPTANLCGIQLPTPGGGYFRLLPYSASRMVLKQFEKTGTQFVMYLHPWEIDPDQPRMEGPVISKIRHYLNLEWTEQRLKYLLRDFTFAPVVEAVRPIRDMCRARVQGGTVASAVSG